LKIGEKYVNTKIKMFQSDDGHEFDDTQLGAHFLGHGIYFRKSCPETQAQNGVAERKHRHLNEIVRGFLIEANVPTSFQIDAVQTMVFVANCLPTPNLQGSSPFEKLFRHSLDYNFLKVFGSACYPNFYGTSSHKLALRSKRCIFFLVMSLIIKVTSVLTLQRDVFILVGMLFFMNIIFLIQNWYPPLPLHLF